MSTRRTTTTTPTDPTPVIQARIERPSGAFQALALCLAQVQAEAPTWRLRAGSAFCAEVGGEHLCMSLVPGPDGELMARLDIGALSGRVAVEDHTGEIHWAERILIPIRTSDRERLLGTLDDDGETIALATEPYGSIFPF